MMTSRSEYRLVLRQDNADPALTHIGYGLGLVPEERMQAVEKKIRRRGTRKYAVWSARASRAAKAGTAC